MLSRQGLHSFGAKKGVGCCTQNRLCCF